VADAEDGPLWDTIKRQLYKSEVSYIKRLVGETLIYQNRVMWDEATNLHQIISDFERRNAEAKEGAKQQQVQWCSSQQRDLLRRQIKIIADDLRAQVEASGHVLEDVVPEFRDQVLVEFLAGEGPSTQNAKDEPHSQSTSPTCRYQPPRTPSTRPSTGCSTPDLTSLPPSLRLGRPLGVDEMGRVADGIREALEAEQESLYAAIAEQTQRFEAEHTRRASCKAFVEQKPSITDLQQLVRKLQEIVVAPTLRTLAMTGGGGSNCPGDADDSDVISPQPISGGASVRRLKALIAQRRRFGVTTLPPLGVVPETPAGAIAAMTPTHHAAAFPGSPASVAKPNFDLFFDDPFAA